MSETQNATRITEVQPMWDVTGLYVHRGVPYRLHAADVNDARRQFHDMFPGFEGTTFRVDPVPQEDHDV